MVLPKRSSRLWRKVAARRRRAGTASPASLLRRRMQRSWMAMPRCPSFMVRVSVSHSAQPPSVAGRLDRRRWGDQMPQLSQSDQTPVSSRTRQRASDWVPRGVSVFQLITRVVKGVVSISGEVKMPSRTSLSRTRAPRPSPSFRERCSSRPVKKSCFEERITVFCIVCHDPSGMIQAQQGLFSLLYRILDGNGRENDKKISTGGNFFENRCVSDEKKV